MLSTRNSSGSALTARDSDLRDTLSIDRAGIERRRGLRIEQARPLKVFDAAASRYFPGKTYDVSATGLRIELPVAAPVRPGKVLQIHVGLSEAGEALANRRHMIPARVVWVRRDESFASGRLTAGVEFLASISAHLDAA